MSELFKNVLWFKSTEINKKWLFGVSKVNETLINQIKFRDFTFILIPEKYYNENLKETTDFLSNNYLSTLGLSSTEKSVPEIFKEIYLERNSLLIDSYKFDGYDNFHKIFQFRSNKIFFHNCQFLNNEFDKQIYLDDLEILLKCVWVSCKISSIVIRLKKPFNNSESNIITKSFFNCDINKFDFSSETGSQLILQNNKIDRLITDSVFIRLNNVILKLFHHTNLDNSKIDFGFDSVEIQFDEKILKDLNKTQYRGFINTFKNLLDNNGLFSERKNISLYLSYFFSRKPWLKKVFFNFNKGYYGIEYPFYLTVFLLFVKMCVLWCFKDNLFTPNFSLSFSPIIFPHKMYEIIFQHFSPNISPIRIFLLLIEITYIYSMYSLLTGVKRFLGFKMEL